MKLRCVLGIEMGSSCEYFVCGDCNRSSINASLNPRIENMELACRGFKMRAKECSVCSSETHHYHYVGDDLLCDGCYRLFYEVNLNMHKRREALKDLVARVRDAAIAKEEDKIACGKPVVIRRERLIGLKMLAISMRERGLISEDSLAEHLGTTPDYLVGAIRATQAADVSLKQEKEKAK
ncbi:MAG: hypothetical protein NWE89_12365 [Candidatus Bathyarchaeota archaeon]|nr:hypothetical protein [Candidatus Bathyarchaeota archaeon]